MTNILENLKAKITEARATMQANADAKYTDDLKKEIGTHISDMDKLLVEVESKGANLNTEYQQKVAESIAKLEKMIQK